MIRRNEPFIIAQHDEIRNFIDSQVEEFRRLHDEGLRWTVLSSVLLYQQLLAVVVNQPFDGIRASKWAVSVAAKNKGAKDAQEKIRLKINYVLRGYTDYHAAEKLLDKVQAVAKQKERTKRSSGSDFLTSPLTFKRPSPAPYRFNPSPRLLPSLPSSLPPSPPPNGFVYAMDIDEPVVGTQDVIDKSVCDLQKFLTGREDRQLKFQVKLFPMLKSIKPKPVPGSKNVAAEFDKKKINEEEHS